jgi:Flp pilus assembly protein TadG
MFRSLFGNRDGTAAVEAAIFVPIFLMFALGITDLGTGMFVWTRINSATQAGAAYAITNKCGSSCLANIKTVMNEAAGDASFCNDATCAASMAACPAADGDPNPASTTCITVSATYTYSPFLPYTAYAWTQSSGVSSTATATVRIQ